ncbi:hypothetical protein [Flavobacterium filum]|uniref:AbiTii domain-containing protein n=1 Tax=Flavobacterium filum TaxID=370974 RepID=UPI0023EFC06F|nr:hypothetical protein [Flavobacterium filum]
MSNSTIHNLQDEINEGNLTTSAILNKALRIAMTLKQDKFIEWIKLEIDGYRNLSLTLPDYRTVIGKYKYFNGRNWDSVNIPCNSVEEERMFTTTQISNDVASIEEWIRQDGDYVKLEIPDIVERLLNKFYGINTKYCFDVVKLQLRSLLKQVNNVVYEWLCKLEVEGIKGINSSFTKEEIDTGQTISYVFNFYSNVNNSQFNMNSNKNKINN